MTLFDKIKTITSIKATSGHEQHMRDYMANQMKPYVDRIEYDGLGGVFGIKESKNPNAKTVMVASHMDEVGFMVTNVKANGMLQVSPLGGWNSQVVSAQRFVLQTNGAEYPVVSSSIPPHLLRGKSGEGKIDVSDILFDAGFESKEEAYGYGVRPGDTIVPDSEAVLTANGKNVIAKAWDNRYGCLVILEVLEALKDTELDYHLVVGANVQEEVGLRGGTVSANKFKPDLFFAVDCSAADDLYTKEATFGHLGEGFLMRILDPRMIMLPRMREFFIEVAEDNDIPYQYFVSKGGTDAGAVHMSNEGVPSAVIGVCARYIHTHQAMFNLDDYKAARAMLQTVLTTLNNDMIQMIIYGEES